MTIKHKFNIELGTEHRVYNLYVTQKPRAFYKRDINENCSSSSGEEKKMYIEIIPKLLCKERFMFVHNLHTLLTTMSITQNNDF